MENRVLKISAINSFFGDDLNCIKRGENGLASGHLETTDFSSELKIIRGKVMASMTKNKSYNVMIYLTPSYDIEKAECSCARGEFICHHMACVALYAHYNISKTDVECSWKPKPRQPEEPKPILPTRDYDPLPGVNVKDLSLESGEKLKQDLKRIDHNMGLLWLLSPEPTEDEEKLLPFIEELLLSEAYSTCADKKAFLEDRLKLDHDKIEEVSKATVGQRNNLSWLIARKHRLTASNFGQIIKASERGRFPPSLFKRLTGSYDLDGVKQIQWGRQRESDGIAALEKTGQVVTETGLWLDECGFIGASPDGFISDTGVVEVKCPYKHRFSNLKSALQKTDIIFWDDDKWQINKNHDYYHQMQGQIYCTKRQFCILVMYTTVDVVHVRIDRCEEWKTNLQILKNFYFEQYIPHVSPISAEPVLLDE